MSSLRAVRYSKPSAATRHSISVRTTVAPNAALSATPSSRIGATAWMTPSLSDSRRLSYLRPRHMVSLRATPDDGEKTVPPHDKKTTVEGLDSVLGIDTQGENESHISSVSAECPAPAAALPTQEAEENRALGVDTQADWAWPPCVNEGGVFDAFDVPWSVQDLAKIMAGLEVVHWGARWGTPLVTDQYWQTLTVEALLQVLAGTGLVFYLLKDYMPDLSSSSLFLVTLKDSDATMAEQDDEQSATASKSDTLRLNKKKHPEAAALEHRRDMFGGYFIKPTKPKAAKQATARSSNPLRRAGGLIECTILTALALQLSGVGPFDLNTAKNAITHQALAGGGQLADVGAFAVCAVLLVPLLSEIVFRGIFLPSLTKWMPVPAAILVGGAAFGVLEQQLTGDSVHLAGLVLLGFVTGFAYCRTRNLATPMVIHSAFNASVFFMCLMSASHFSGDISPSTTIAFMHPHFFM